MKHKIRPVQTDANDAFDGVDQIVEGGSETKGHRRKARILPVPTDDAFSSEPRRKPKPGSGETGFSTNNRSRRTTAYSSSKSWRNQLHILSTVKAMLFSTTSLKLAAPFVALGLLLSGVCEMFLHNQRYNFVLILALAAAMKFPHFPPSTVRGQLCLSACTLASFGLDIYVLSVHFQTYSSGYSSLLILVAFCKLVVFYAFLHNISSASRTRKYLDRRLRLFLLPLRAPRRIMRDVRARMLALGWLHLAMVFTYAVLWLVYFNVLDYAHLTLTPYTSSNLSFFLLIKLCTSILVLSGLLYDTDLRLCLWYFGCLAFRLQTIRAYIQSVYNRLHGYPLAFSFSGLRFRILFVVKGIDVAWGAYGWVILSRSLGRQFASLDETIQAYLSFVALALVVGDVYGVLLFGAVQWLWRRQKLLLKFKVLPDSDDSELDDFHLRCAPRTQRNPLQAEESILDDDNVVEAADEEKEEEEEHKAEVGEEQPFLALKEKPPPELDSAQVVRPPSAVDSPPLTRQAFFRQLQQEREEEEEREGWEDAVGYDVLSATSRSRAAMPHLSRGQSPSEHSSGARHRPARRPRGLIYRIRAMEEEAAANQSSSASERDD